MSRYIPAEVTLEDRACPNGCEVNDRVVLTGVDRLFGLPGEFDICRCRLCGLERTNPRPTPETIGFYYPEQYGPYNKAASDSNSKGSKKSKLVLKKLGFYSNQLPEAVEFMNGRALELGCADGTYMEQLRDLGWVVEGIEFSEYATKIARQKGFNVSQASVEATPEPSDKYSLIVGWMVFEHMHEPHMVLRRLHRWTLEGASLVLSVPDSASILRRVFGNLSYDLQLPTHLYHFNQSTLGYLLEQNGWRLTDVRWQRNSNTLLMSLQYWVDQRNLKNTSKLVTWLRTSSRAAYLRVGLSILLGLTRQSGRIEVFATRKPELSNTNDN